jgi:hypothetical protein
MTKKANAIVKKWLAMGGMKNYDAVLSNGIL